MLFKDSVTKENVAKGFAGLCQDHARYIFISKSAISEGYFYIGEKLKEIAKNKLAHASALYSIMLKEIKRKDSVNIEAGYPFENHMLKTSLLDSAEIETYQADNVYPHFAKIASDEGFKDIAEKFTLISKIGEENARFLHALALKFDSHSLYQSKEKVTYKCSNCGHRHTSTKAWENCPLCNYPQGYVEIPIDKD